MVMQAINGYLENGRFTPSDMISLPIRTDAILVIKEQIQPSKPKDHKKAWADFMDGLDEVQKEDKELRAAWLERLDKALRLSENEELPDFPRSGLMREPVNLAD
jgi:hypothetical protein